MIGLVASIVLGACSTPCGLITVGTDCSALARVEEKALVAFDRFTAFKAPNSCAALEGWVVLVHTRRATDDQCGADAFWVTSRKLCVLGVAYIERKVIEVQDDRFATNALVHELAHVQVTAVGGTALHCKWTEKGLIAAIESATALPEDVEQDCP